MKAPDESSIMKDFPENATEWIAADGKRCTDGGGGSCLRGPGAVAVIIYNTILARRHTVTCLLPGENAVTYVSIFLN